MGIVKQLVLLPLAPVRGVVWLTERIAEAAELEMGDPDAVRAHLIDARVVVASVDTYLRFAEAVNRLDLTAVGDHATIQDIGREGAEQKTKGAIEGAKEALHVGGKDREKEKAEARS